MSVQRQMIEDQNRHAGARVAVAILLVALMVAGYWLRVRHLGRLCLTVDEGFQALAVQSILDQGVPLLDTGWVYLRSPLFLYLQAATSKWLGQSEFSMRLPAVLAGVAVIPAGYLLGRQLFGRSTGLLTAALLALSAWEIEISRYARFYTLFQATYVLALVFFYRGFILDRKRDRLWFFLAAIVSISLHDIGVMIGGCFLIIIPLKSYSACRKLTFVALAAVHGVVWKLYSLAFGAVQDLIAEPLATVGTTGEPATAGGLSAKLAGLLPPLKAPDLRYLDPLMANHSVVAAAVAVPPAAATIYLALRSIRHSSPLGGLLAAGMIWAAYAHQAALAMVIAVVYVAFFVRSRQNLLNPSFIVGLTTSLLCLAFWGLWVHFIHDIGPHYSIWQMMLFPDLEGYFFRWFRTGWPVMLVLGAIGVVGLARRAGAQEQARGPWFVLAALFVPLVLASIPDSRWREARYFFNLYPLILVIYAVMVVAAASWAADRMAPHRSVAHSAVAAAVILVALFLSQDANPAKAYRIGDRDYTTAKDTIRSVLNWEFYAGFHQDQKKPSLYAKKHLGQGDQVLAVGPPHKASVYRFYLGRLDYIVRDPQTYMVTIRTKDGRDIDPVTGAQIVWGHDPLKAVIEAPRDGDLWILSDTVMTTAENWFLNDPTDPHDRTKRYLASLTDKPEDIGRDQKTFAARIR